MGWDHWEYPSRPRRRANGILPKSTSGTFGKSWWASRWIDALARLTAANRLTRGRSYARSGQVVKLDVDQNGVDARVQGSRPTPYKIAIGFKRLTNDEWARVIDRMASEAIYAAQLLSGTMPEKIEEVFAAAQVSLFPSSQKDMTTNCSCPDWENPCKHVAAVHYLLGERFDDDPFLMFVLRGRAKDDIIAALRARRSGDAPATDAPSTSKAEAIESAPPLAASLAAFWTLPTDIGDLIWSFDPPPVDALPVKSLGRPTFWPADWDFATTWEIAYRAIGDHARDVAFGTED